MKKGSRFGSKKTSDPIKKSILGRVEYISLSNSDHFRCFIKTSFSEWSLLTEIFKLFNFNDWVIKLSSSRLLIKSSVAIILFRLQYFLETIEGNEVPAPNCYKLIAFKTKWVKCFINL